MTPGRDPSRSLSFDLLRCVIAAGCGFSTSRSTIARSELFVAPLLWTAAARRSSVGATVRACCWLRLWRRPIRALRFSSSRSRVSKAANAATRCRSATSTHRWSSMRWPIRHRRSSRAMREIEVMRLDHQSPLTLPVAGSAVIALLVPQAARAQITSKQAQRYNSACWFRTPPHPYDSLQEPISTVTATWTSQCRSPGQQSLTLAPDQLRGVGRSRYGRRTDLRHHVRYRWRWRDRFGNDEFRSRTISVLLNDGGGAFASSVEYVSGTGPVPQRGLQ